MKQIIRRVVWSAGGMVRKRFTTPTQVLDVRFSTYKSTYSYKALMHSPHCRSFLQPYHRHLAVAAPYVGLSI